MYGVNPTPFNRGDVVIRLLAQLDYSALADAAWKLDKLEIALTGSLDDEVTKLRKSFFFSSRRRHTSCSRDWSSDVCSSDLPDVKLVLVGDGPLEAELRQQSDGCVIAGRKVNGELAAHYASADVFLFPSMSETWGNVTLEAMASGLGIVAYDYAAAREVLRHGTSALLAPFGNSAAFIAHAETLAQDPA